MCKQLNANTYYDLGEKRVYIIKKILLEKKCNWLKNTKKCEITHKNIVEVIAGFQIDTQYS